MEFIQAHSSNYTKGRTQRIQYIVMHYTGNINDTAKANCVYFSEPERNASAHYFIDAGGVIQSVKDGDTAWHCGAKKYNHPYCRNGNSIGIEMCTGWIEGKYVIDDKTADNAVKLVRELMERYGVPEGNILRHYDVTGKRCPAPWVNEPDKWEKFKRRLKGMEEMTLEEAKKAVKEKFGFDENTMLYLEMYRYGEALIRRLAEGR